MMIIITFFTSFIIALSGALAPGPLLVLVLGESRRHGWKTGPLVILGHALLETMMVAGLLLGSARFLHNRNLLSWISLLGGGLLLFFGVQLIVSADKYSLEIPAGPVSGQGKLVLKGFLVSLSNPYWTIWWLTAGLGLLLSSRNLGWPAVGAFLLGHLSADFWWYFLVAAFMAGGNKFISPAVYRRLLAGCGVILILFAGYFLFGRY